MATIEITCYMTAGVKKHLLKHSAAVKLALEEFQQGNFGKVEEKPQNELIQDFGAYELSFGTLWIISYHLFSSRDFITLLLPCEYEGHMRGEITKLSWPLK